MDQNLEVALLDELLELGDVDRDGSLDPLLQRLVTAALDSHQQPLAAVDLAKAGDYRRPVWDGRDCLFKVGTREEVGLLTQVPDLAPGHEGRLEKVLGPHVAHRPPRGRERVRIAHDVEPRQVWERQWQRGGQLRDAAVVGVLVADEGEVQVLDGACCHVGVRGRHGQPQLGRGRAMQGGAAATSRSRRPGSVPFRHERRGHGRRRGRGPLMVPGSINDVTLGSASSAPATKSTLAAV